MIRFALEAILGTLAAIALLVLLAVAAMADTFRFSHSDVTLRETARPGAVAEVLFENSGMDGLLAGTRPLSLGDLTCSVAIEVGLARPDTIEVDCEGHVAVPRVLTIEDGTDGVLFIYPLTWSGM